SSANTSTARSDKREITIWHHTIKLTRRSESKNKTTSSENSPVLLRRTGGVGGRQLGGRAQFAQPAGQPGQPVRGVLQQVLLLAHPAGRHRATGRGDDAPVAVHAFVQFGPQPADVLLQRGLVRFGGVLERRFDRGQPLRHL